MTRVPETNLSVFNMRESAALSRQGCRCEICGSTDVAGRDDDTMDLLCEDCLCRTAEAEEILRDLSPMDNRAFLKALEEDEK